MAGEMRTTGVLRLAAAWVVVAVGLSGCGPLDDPIESDVSRELERGGAYAEWLTRPNLAAPPLSEAIAAGYVERLRLGLGSPFRLIEHSLQDPRLPKAERERLAWGLLERTRRGSSYQVGPEVLVPDRPDVGARHMGLITGAVRGPADPDAGVLAVRLAYAMAEAEGTVPASLSRRVSRVAVLIRDRVTSQADVDRLLSAAGSRTDPMALLMVWRVEGRFAVEQPTVLSPTSAVQRDAATMAPRILRSIRAIADGRAETGPRDPTATRPLLDDEAARVLAEHAARENAPPQTPVVIGVRSYRSVAPDDTARQRFFEAAVNEERLAAEAALLRHRVGDPGRAVDFATVAAAVGLRAYAQERPWFPGFGGPAERDLEDRYGLRAVEFPSDFPAHWRPYYRRLLASALGDLRRVLPSLDLRGLRVRFAPRDGSSGTLAVHDPGTRTIYLPAETGAGTLAHEIAHDVDWQTALRRYGVRGDYGTDRAVRLADGTIAVALQGLTMASLTDLPPTRHSHATRPAEIFARNMDWFVAVSLAREGRLNGYLSSIQDDVLTGYGTVTAPDPSGGAGQALVTLLDEVAPVYADTRRWFLGRYGRDRSPTAYDLARTLVEAPLGPADPTGEDADVAPALPEVPDELLLEAEPDTAAADSLAADSLAADSVAMAPRPDLTRVGVALRRLDRLEAVRDDVLARVDGACEAVAYDNGTTTARRRLVRQVTEARARGEALQAARSVGGERAREWLAARFEGRTRDPAPPPAVLAVLEHLAERVERIGREPARGSGVAASERVESCGFAPGAAGQTPATSAPQTSLWSWSW